MPLTKSFLKSMSPCLLKERLHPLDLLATDEREGVGKFLTEDGHESVVVLHVDAAHIVAVQATLLGEEAHDVALAQLVLLPFTYIYSGPSGRLRLGRVQRKGKLLGSVLHILRHVLLGMDEEEGIALGLPAGRTSVAVDVAVLVGGQMVVDNIVNMRNVKTPCSKVGADKDMATTVAEAVERTLAVGLLHTSMKHTATDACRLQVLPYPLHGLAVVHKDEARPFAKRTEQVAQRLQFVLLGRMYHVKTDAGRYLLLVTEEVETDTLLTHTGKLRNLVGISGREQNLLRKAGRRLMTLSISS